MTDLDSGVGVLLQCVSISMGLSPSLLDPWTLEKLARQNRSRALHAREHWRRDGASLLRALARDRRMFANEMLREVIGHAQQGFPY